jgi:hypothetical protein
MLRQLLILLCFAVPVNAASYTLTSGDVAGYFHFEANAVTDRLFSYTINGLTHHWTVDDSNYYSTLSGSFLSTNAKNMTLTFQFCFDDCRMIQGTIPLQNAYTANVFDNNRAYRPASTTGFFNATNSQAASATSIPLPGMTVFTLALGTLMALTRLSSVCR